MKNILIVFGLLLLVGCNQVKSETYICNLESTQEYFESSIMTLKGENDILNYIETAIILDFKSEELATQALQQQETLLIEMRAISGVEATIEALDTTKVTYLIKVNINDNNIYDLKSSNILVTEVGGEGILLTKAVEDLEGIGFTCAIE